MFFSSFCLMYNMTTATLTPSIFGNVSIFWCKFMAIDTMSFLTVFDAVCASIGILSMIFCTGSPIMTSPTLTLLKLIRNQILTRQCVAMFAMCFNCMNPSPHIDSVSDWFQMRRINTKPISTQVIQLQPFWCNFYKKFISQFVNTNSFTFESQTRITSGTQRTGCFPTRSSSKEIFNTHGDFGEQPSQYFAINNHLISNVGHKIY